MHVLLVTPQVDGETASPDLAAAWHAASPRSVIDVLVLPAAAPTAGAPRGVFVPTSSLGLRSTDGEQVAARLVPLHEHAARADVVVVHRPVLDATALHEGPVAEAARAAAPHAVPVVVLAGQDHTSRRELAAAGVSAVHVVGDPCDPARVGRAARTWDPAWAAGDTEV